MEKASLTKLKPEVVSDELQKKYLDDFLSLFKPENQNEDYITLLKNQYEVDNIKVKPLTVFDTPHFYKILIQDILFHLKTQLGVAILNFEKAKALTVVFNSLIPMITLELSKDPNLKLCFSLLYNIFVFDKTTEETMNLLSSCIVCLNEITLNGCFNKMNKIFIENINYDFYHTIQKQVYLIIDQRIKALNASEKEKLIFNLELQCENTQNVDWDMQAELSRVKSLTREEKEMEKNKIDEIECNFKKYGKIESFTTFCQFVQQFENFIPIFIEHVDLFIFFYLDTRNNLCEQKLCFDLIKCYYNFSLFKESLEKGYRLPDPASIFLLINQMFILSKHKDYTKEIQSIINKKENIETFISILQSQVVQDYYTSKNEEVKAITEGYQTKVLPFNLTNYNFNEVTTAINETIKVMYLSQDIKALTTSFLRIAINSKWIQIANSKHDSNEINTLLTGYILIVIFHESNQFLRRYFNQSQYESMIQNPKNDDEKQNGGEIMFRKIFGVDCINELDITKARFILNPQNWKSKEQLAKIIKAPIQNNSSIRFMTSKKKKVTHFCCIHEPD